MTDRWLFVADDLTGACDVVAPFAAAIVSLPASRCTDHDAVAMSVCVPVREVFESGRSDAALIAATLADAIDRHGTDRRLFLKVDSAGRSDYDSAFTVASARGRPLVCPAFPANGRTVEDGILCVHGHAVLDLRERFGAAAIDARSESDLIAIAARVADEPELVPIASAGLARAIALAPAALPASPHVSAALVVVGSRHDATARQRRHLVHATPADVTVLSTDTDTDTHSDTDTDTDAPDVLDRLAEATIDAVDHSVAATGLVLTGGDTALAVLARLGTSLLRIDGEFAPGLPVGIALDGAIAGWPVALKSGGFGGETALADLVRWMMAS